MHFASLESLSDLTDIPKVKYLLDKPQKLLERSWPTGGQEHP